MTSYLITRMNRELRKMKYRAMGSAALIVLSVTFYIGMAGMIPNTEKALEDKVEELRLNDYLVHVNGANDTDREGLAAMPGVEDVECRVQVSSRAYYLDGGEQNDVSAYLYGINTTREPTRERYARGATVNIPELFGSDSRNFQGNGNDHGSVLIERNFAGNEGIEVGDTISVQSGNGTVDLEVIGLVLSPEFIMLPVNPNSLLPYPGNLAVLFVPMDWLRGAFGFPDGFVNEFCFMFEDDVTASESAKEELQRDINNRLASDIIIYSVPRDQVYGYALIKEDLAQGQTSAALFAGIILLVAFFIVYVSFARIVQEQRKEIGILRALGYSRNAVLGSYLYMALIIGSASSLVGILLGIPFSRSMGEFYVDLMIGTSLSGFQVPWGPIIAGAFFGPITACLASGIAVWGTVTMEPQEAIRGTPRSALKAKKSGEIRRLKKLEQIFSSPARRMKNPSGRPPGGPLARFLRGRYILHYTFRGMSRNRMRTLFTAFAVALSILIASFPFLMLDSIVNSMNKSVDDCEKWDILVEYAYPLTADQAGTVNSSDIIEFTYISRIQGAWQKAGTTGQEDDQWSFTLIAGLDQEQGFHRFDIRKGRLPDSPGEIMINDNMADENSIGTGDVLVLQTRSGKMELKVTALVNDVLGEIFVDMSIIEQLTGEALYSGMYANVRSGTEKQVRDELKESPLVSEAVTRDGTKSGLLDLMESTGDIIYVFSLMGVAIAAATLANTIFIGVLERYPEYGQLRAIGYSKRDVAKGVVAEIMTLVTFGSIMGAPLTYLFLKAYESEFEAFFPMYDTILAPGDWMSYVFVVCLTFGLALLAALPSIRLVNRMDIAKTVSGARFG